MPGFGFTHSPASHGLRRSEAIIPLETDQYAGEPHACQIGALQLLPAHQQPTRRWDNAGGQLLGFLGYDLVLIGPFLRRFATLPPGHTLSLVTYVIVLLYSGALAVYFLVLARPTRRWPVKR